MVKKVNPRVKAYEVVWGTISPVLSAFISTLTGPWRFLKHLLPLLNTHLLKPLYMIATRKIVMAKKVEEIKNKNKDIQDAQTDDDFMDSVNNF